MNVKHNKLKPISAIQLNFEEGHESDEVLALSDDDARSEVLLSSFSTTSAKKKTTKDIDDQSHYHIPFLSQNISHIMLKWHWLLRWWPGMQLLNLYLLLLGKCLVIKDTQQIWIIKMSLRQ